MKCFTERRRTSCIKQCGYKIWRAYWDSSHKNNTINDNTIFWKQPDVTHFRSAFYAPVHACGSAQRSINNIYSSLGAPRQEKSVYVTSTLNTLSTIHGHRYIGGSSTTHSRLTPSPRNPREYPKCTLYFQKLESFIYIFPLTVCVYFHSFFFWWAPQLPARLFYF